jgi:hypothetical protein
MEGKPMSGQTYKQGLRSPAVTVRVFGLYLLGLALVLMTIPNTLLAIFGIANTQEYWIRVVGLLAGVIGFLFTRYAPHGDRTFFGSPCRRASVIVFFLVFVLFASAPWQLLLFGAVDLAGAGWTWWTLAADKGVAPA